MRATVGQLAVRAVHRSPLLDDAGPGRRLSSQAVQQPRVPASGEAQAVSDTPGGPPPPATPRRSTPRAARPPPAGGTTTGRAAPGCRGRRPSRRRRCRRAAPRLRTCARHCHRRGCRPFESAPAGRAARRRRRPRSWPAAPARPCHARSAAPRRQGRAVRSCGRSKGRDCWVTKFRVESSGISWPVADPVPWAPIRASWMPWMSWKTLVSPTLSTCHDQAL